MVKSFNSDEFIFFNKEPKEEWLGKGFNEYQHWIGEFDNPLDPWTDNPEIGRLCEKDVKEMFPMLYEAEQNVKHGKGVDFDINIKVHTENLL